MDSIDTYHDPAFAPLREALSSLDAPPRVEKALKAAFARQYPRRRWYQRLSALQWSASGLATAVTVAVVFVLTVHRPAPLIERADGGVFIAVEPLDRIERETDARVVETELPRSALAGAGLPTSPEEAGDSVRAQLLVSADGEPLAVRLSIP